MYGKTSLLLFNTYKRACCKSSTLEVITCSPPALDFFGFLDRIMDIHENAYAHEETKIVRIIFIVIFHKFFDEITKVLSNNIIHETYRNIVNLDPVGTVKKGINAGSLSSFIAPNIKRRKTIPGNGPGGPGEPR